MKLNEKYNPESFITFIQDFLPEDFKLREEDIVINKDRYKEIIKARILGFCESLDLYVLEMDHTHNKDPRVTIATDAFKILADHWIHRALIIFKNNDSDNYRFSYLTITLDLNEKNKVIKRYSNARRYSFYLGSNAKVRTPEQQLIKKGRVENVDDLFNRFSIEVVNEQFFLEIVKFFDKLVFIENQNLILPGVSEVNINIRKSFAIRLIGRIMFCWFLKQKKSERGQLIPDEILSSKIVSDNYYHNVIEPLFFEVLNTSIDIRDVRTDLFDKVPYLNGSLFNPQSEDYYEFDKNNFYSKYINTLKINDNWFKEFFELLETYNFTIDENTVFDQELSIDPEMLGRIFEKLLAEINPETGSSERKRTGSFYTPREIVEYMVNQSLIEYFKNKTKIKEKKLNALVSYDFNDNIGYPLEQKEKEQIVGAIESLKILDPACGSGAYPIGVLQKIVHILQQVDPECTLWIEKKLQGVPDLYKQKIINELKQNSFNYTRKLDIIKNSIFGIDIQPIAVDISRLRCFLTLIVESEIDDSKPNRGIEPLPNLDFKFVCANTLVPLPKYRNTGLFDNDLGIIELSRIMFEYFSCNTQRKNELKIKFINTQKEIFKKSISAFGKNTGDLTLKLITWNPFSNDSNPWFDPEWMFGLQEKFDVVIGNPPYISLEKIKEDKEFFKGHYKVFSGRGDLYVLFFERSINLLKENNGILIFITSNKWLRAGYGEKLRDYFLKNTNPILLINLGGGVFENATVDTSILLVQKMKNKNNLKAVSIDKKTNFLTENMKNKLNSVSFSHGEIWTILSPMEQSIKRKIEAVGTPLKDWDISINYGIKTGCNEAFIINQKKRDELIKKDPKSAEIIRPILRGRDIKRNSYKWAGKYVIATFPAKKYNIDEYPAIKKYLLGFGKERLEQSGKKDINGIKGLNARKKTNNKWFEIQDSIAYWDDFNRQKIIFPAIMSKGPFFSLNNDNFMITAPGNLITGEKLKGLLSFLISSTCYYLLKKFYMGGGIEGELKINRLLLLPIPRNIEDRFYTEKEISEIYELNDDEIRLISSRFKPIIN